MVYYQLSPTLWNSAVSKLNSRFMRTPSRFFNIFLTVFKRHEIMPRRIQRFLYGLDNNYILKFLSSNQQASLPLHCNKTDHIFGQSHEERCLPRNRRLFIKCHFQVQWLHSHDQGARVLNFETYFFRHIYWTSADIFTMRAQPVENGI